jgi:hypothetical protein
MSFIWRYTWISIGIKAWSLHNGIARHRGLKEPQPVPLRCSTSRVCMAGPDRRFQASIFHRSIIPHRNFISSILVYLLIFPTATTGNGSRFCLREIKMARTSTFAQQKSTSKKVVEQSFPHYDLPWEKVESYFKGKWPDWTDYQQKKVSWQDRVTA